MLKFNFAGRIVAGIFAVLKHWLAWISEGELAQLARALAWHARGRRFDSDILHKMKRVSNQ